MLTTRPKVIAHMLERFREDAIALETKAPELVKQYPNYWAGMRHGTLRVALNLAKLIEKFGDGRNVAVLYLNPDPKKLILNSERPAATERRP